MSDESNERNWGSLLNGMRRFYGEGMHVWKRAHFAAVFESEDFAFSPAVQARLRALEQSGYIEMRGRADSYLVVLKPPPPLFDRQDHSIA